jgi:hypothetical protein
MAGFAGAVMAGAASGVAGSVVSQGFGVATGLQDKFSWKQVAMAGIAGGVSGGIGHVLGQAGLAGSKILTGIVRGVASSGLTQGIAVTVGLQKKFDFAGVAAAGIGGGIMGAIGGQPLDKNNSFANHMTHAGAGAASAIANATVRTLINGTDFGDNLIAALPDVIGSTIGNMVAYGVGGTGGGSTTGTAVAAAKDTVAKLPDPLVAAIRARGGELIVQRDGTILVKGYRPGSAFAQAAGGSAAYTFGSDLEGAWFGGYGSHVFVDTHNAATWTPGANDGEGVNFDFGSWAGMIRSDWIESGGTAVRIISGAGGSYLYNGGVQAYSALGLQVSYGADVVPAGYYGSGCSGRVRRQWRQRHLAGLQLHPAPDKLHATFLGRPELYCGELSRRFHLEPGQAVGDDEHAADDRPHRPAAGGIIRWDRLRHGPQSWGEPGRARPGLWSRIRR